MPFQLHRYFKNDALVGTGARIEEYIYNTDGLLQDVTVRNGTGGTAIKLRSYTYVSGHGNVRPMATETVYRQEGGLEPATTGYAHTWHGSTNQIASRTTTLPSVPTTENGRNTTVTRVEIIDAMGYRTSSTDERGTETTYGYDKLRGAMIQMVRDAGGLDLTTDYQIDDRGRVTRTLGPAHDAIIGGASVNIRTGSWTYYEDREGKEVSFRGYLKTSADSQHAVGPVTVKEPNLAPPSGYSGYRQSSTYDAAYSGTGIPAPTTTFDQADWVRWTIDLIDQASELNERWSYFKIPSSGYGTQSTNYGKKLYGYDVAGRQNETTCAGGTIDKTTFNAMGWATQEELGTSEGLTVVRSNKYDDDGNLTKVTRPVDSTPGHDRVTDYDYDWRNRRTEEKTPLVEKDGGGTWTLIRKVTYDNRGLVLTSTGYHTAVDDANRTSYQEMDHDVLGRQYRTRVYGVNATTGDTSNPQESNVYYEPGNQVARNAPSGSKLFTAITYDALGRALGTFRAYEPSGFTPGSDPASVTNAVVMEQSLNAWDEAGNLLWVKSKARFDDVLPTVTGELGDPATSPEARVSYLASYADAIGRGIAIANYGTYGDDPWTRDPTVPTRSDDILVNSTEYDDAGNATHIIDPAGMETTRAYDDAGRLVTVVENAAGSGSEVRTTHYEYTDDGWLKKLKSDNTDTGQQVTEWVYGVGPTISPASALYSKRLVLRKIYPGGGGDEVEYSYNRQLQVTGMTDQLGTVHAYTYDTLGRLLADTATITDSAVDNRVGKLETAYDERGRVIRSASYDSTGTTVRNEVVRAYNDFNQLVTEWQEHGAAVNTTTSPKVEYSYENGSANTVRPTGMTYPDGSTTITTAYTGTQANDLSRPDQVKEGGGIIASMRFLGLGTLVGLDYEAASHVELTYENGGTGDAGDKYTGLDRFGRLVETIWKDASEDKVHSKFGRNRAGGVVWRKDVKAHSLTVPVTTQDNYYWYDGLQQVSRHERGTLPGSPPYSGVTSPQQVEDFTYDETGNWLGYDATAPTSLAQTREQNPANQITKIINPASVVQPGYDAAGNMRVMPDPRDWTEQFDCTWDAWNRLVKIERDAAVLESYQYDALTRRTRKTAGSVTRDFYYDRQWRSIEEHEDSTVKEQHTWSPLDRWTLIRRKRSVSGELDETLFCLRDYLDPVAVVDGSGEVVERYGYDAFGPVRYMDAEFATITTSTVDWNFLFHGEFIDDGTGLYNYGYRYYHPQLGKWPSRDPIGERGGCNLYGFVGNDGTNRVDRLGLIPNIGLWDKDCCTNSTGGYCASAASFREKFNPFDSTIELPGSQQATNLSHFGEWFKARFPKLSGHIENDLKNQIGQSIKNSLCSGNGMPSDFPSLEINGYGTGERPMPNNPQTEGDFGDEPQGSWEASQVLGNYNIIVTESSFEKVECCAIGPCYSWKATVSVVDGLGANPANVQGYEWMWPVVQFLFGDERPAVIAQWDAEGFFCCE
jgi:RHS repeat-associated protein